MKFRAELNLSFLHSKKHFESDNENWAYVDEAGNRIDTERPWKDGPLLWLMTSEYAGSVDVVEEEE